MSMREPVFMRLSEKSEEGLFTCIGILETKWKKIVKNRVLGDIT